MKKHESKKLTGYKELIARWSREMFAVNKRWSVQARLDYVHMLVGKCSGLKAHEVSTLYEYATRLVTPN